MNAADNPFNVQRIHALAYRLDGVTWQELLGRFQALGCCAAITGPHGHGKSTLLNAFGGVLESHGYQTQHFCFTKEAKRKDKRAVLETMDALDRETVILIDGAEQLSSMYWRVLRRRSAGCGLLITTHQPARLPTLYECRTSPELLDELLDELLGAESEEWRAEAHELYTRHQGNLREVWFRLYDRFAVHHADV